MLIQQANSRQRENAAFTLVELLVVIAILLLITVTAIPLLSPTDVQKVRDAAITVSGMITRVKSAAAEQETRGAGLWLQPLADVETPGAVLDMYTSLSLDPYAGDDPEAAGVFIYSPAIGSPKEVAFDDADEGRAEIQFLPPGPEQFRVLIFPAESCSSIWDLCAASSRASVASGDKYTFKLLPRKADAVPLHLLPEPYRPWKTPCNYSIYDESNNKVVANTIGVPVIPGLTNNPSYDYSASQWEYPTVDWTIGCFVGVLLPPEGVAITPTDSNYYGFKASDGTPISRPNKAAFSIDRPNTRAPTPPLTLPAGYAIDLTWSGWGNVLFRANLDIDDPSVAGFGFLADMVVTEPIQIMFTKDGKPDELIYRKNQLIYQTIERIEASLRNLGDVCLLVGRADRCGKPFSEAAYADSGILGANWQYPDSRWIRISRTTGQVTISEPYPNARTLKDSLIYAKAGISAGRG